MKELTPEALEKVYESLPPSYRLLCRYIDSQAHKGDVPRANAATSANLDRVVDVAAQIHASTQAHMVSSTATAPTPHGAVAAIGNPGEGI
jgi:hypothetical protein